MNIVLSLVECDGGTWSICRDSVALAGQLRLGAAIKLARKMARDEHCRSGDSVSVLLTGIQQDIQLARYATESVAA